MVVFDAEVFAGGTLVAEVPEAWRARLHELNTQYMRTAEDGSAWVSAYLPVNAMAHAVGLKLGAFTLVAPAFAALGLLGTWGAARRLFPEHRAAPTVAALLYLSSSQVWLTAMTPYAMSGHLALNMVWLWLALGTGRARLMAAGLTSSLAVGLHQLLFHPMFGLPFLALLAWRGRWRPALFHACVLGAAMVFWTIYPSLVLTEGATDGRDDGVIGILVHFWEVLADPKPYAFGAMAGNALRFIVWQNLAFLPLVAAAGALAWRTRDERLLALWAAFLLTPAVMAVLIPEEFHGWGYRYMHGAIGAGCLLGAAGFAALRQVGRPAVGFLAAGTAVAVLVQLPFLTIQTARHMAPYAAADRALSDRTEPVIEVSKSEELPDADFVFNGPGLEAPVRVRAGDRDRLTNQKGDTHD
jgi:hypothetical protein